MHTYKAQLNTLLNKGLSAIILLTFMWALCPKVSAQHVDQFKTQEFQLITLRNQLEKAQTNSEKKKIIKQIAKTGTFLGMTTAAKYLNVEGLKKEAAATVTEIALSHKEYNGANTRNWLTQAMDILGGSKKKAILNYLSDEPSKEQGFVSLFNGKDLTGWKGLVENPIKRAQMSADEMAKAQAVADESMRRDWKVQDGMLTYAGTGYDNLCTVKQYGDFEMYVDWKLDAKGKEPDAGIYLRGTPQVQIWDTSRVNVGAQVGSGGLYNNQKYESKPSQVADNTLGEWNSFYIKMVGDRVTVKLNGVTVVDNVILENYWDRNLPIFPREQLELQAHGSRTYFRDIYVKELR
jgi:hypothetical protein